jgi:hypothetical protein
MKTVALLLLATLLGAMPTAAAKETPAKNEVSKKERDRAIGKAFAFLDSKLSAMTDAAGTPMKPFTFAVAGLDYLLAGKGRKGDPVPKILAYLERWVDNTDRRYRDPKLIPDRHAADSRFLTQVNWPLAQTAVFLVELDARGRYRERARRTLAKIIRLLEAAQEANGGWGHERLGKPAAKTEEPRTPGRLVLSGYPRTLLATTNCVATGLGIARAWRGKKSVKGLDRAVTYYRKARLSDGNFPYDERQNAASETGVGRTAGALLAMHWLGVPHPDSDFRGSRDFVLARLPMIAEGHGSPALNVFQAAFLMRILGDDEFGKFRKEYFRRIIDAQQDDGSLRCVCRQTVCGVTCDSKPLLPGSSFHTDEKVYVTALHLFALLLDRGKLSLLGKKPVPAKPKAETTPGK